MSDSVNRLNMEYKLLKHSIQITKENLLAASRKRDYDPDIAKLFSILDCSIDQINKTFKLARNDGETKIMKKIVRENFKHERLMIQTLAVKIYRVSRFMALKIVYEMWRASINEELNILHSDYEDLVKTRSAEELVDNPEYHRVLDNFVDHQTTSEIHDELFVEAAENNSVDDMRRLIAHDIPRELKVIENIRKLISKLQ